MSPRKLLPNERHVLDVLLSRPFRGRDELHAQASVATVTDLSCECGCPSIALGVDRTATPAPVHGMVADGDGVDSDGNLVGVLLWVDDEGYMNDLEVFGYGPDIHGRPSTTMHGWPTVEHGCSTCSPRIRSPFPPCGPFCRMSGVLPSGLNACSQRQCGCIGSRSPITRSLTNHCRSTVGHHHGTLDEWRGREALRRRRGLRAARLPRTARRTSTSWTPHHLPCSRTSTR